MIDYPPPIATEILSPGDIAGQVDEKLEDYFNFGMENIWIFDTNLRIAKTASRAGRRLVLTDELTVPGTAIRVMLSQLFAGLD